MQKESINCVPGKQGRLVDKLDRLEKEIYELSDVGMRIKSKCDSLGVTSGVLNKPEQEDDPNNTLDGKFNQLLQKLSYITGRYNDIYNQLQELI